MSYLLDIMLQGLPPTVNHFYRSARGGRRYKTPEGRVFQEATVLEIKGKARQRTPYTGRVALHIIMTCRTQRRWDLDNRVKAVQDCIQAAGIIADDSQIDELVVLRERLPKIDRTRVIVMTRGPDNG